MFFSTTAPTGFRRPVYSPSDRSLERFLAETQMTSRQPACRVTQDEKAFSLTFDVPGIAKEELNIGIEGSVVRIDTKENASRQYKAAYELPQDIDAEASEAKLENGVLTLKLGKLQPASKVKELVIS